MGPPQACSLFPVQGVLQLASSAGTPPGARVLPQTEAGRPLAPRRSRGVSSTEPLAVETKNGQSRHTALAIPLGSGIAVSSSIAVAHAGLISHGVRRHVGRLVDCPPNVPVTIVRTKAPSRSDPASQLCKGPVKGRLEEGVHIAAEVGPWCRQSRSHESLRNKRSGTSIRKL